MNGKTIAHGAMVALTAWVVVWIGWLQPPDLVPPEAIIAITVCFLLPGLILLALKHRHAAFVGALGALFTFCQGVTEAWNHADSPAGGLIETALSVVVIVGASLDGLRARFGKKRGV